MFPPPPASEPSTRMGGATRSRAASTATAAGRPEPRGDVRDLRPSLRDRLRYAVDLAVAFATLRDNNELDSAHEPVDSVHPHRTPLRPPTRPRRPGAAVPRAQVCATPVEGTPARLPRRRRRDDA